MNGRSREFFQNLLTRPWNLLRGPHDNSERTTFPQTTLERIVGYVREDAQSGGNNNLPVYDRNSAQFWRESAERLRGEAAIAHGHLSGHFPPGVVQAGLPDAEDHGPSSHAGPAPVPEGSGAPGHLRTQQLATREPRRVARCMTRPDGQEPPDTPAGPSHAADGAARTAESRPRHSVFTAINTPQPSARGSSHTGVSPYGGLPIVKQAIHPSNASSSSSAALSGPIRTHDRLLREEREGDGEAEAPAPATATAPSHRGDSSGPVAAAAHAPRSKATSAHAQPPVTIEISSDSEPEAPAGHTRHGTGREGRSRNRTSHHDRSSRSATSSASRPAAPHTAPRKQRIGADDEIFVVGSDDDSVIEARPQARRPQHGNRAPARASYGHGSDHGTHDPSQNMASLLAGTPGHGSAVGRGSLADILAGHAAAEHAASRIVHDLTGDPTPPPAPARRPAAGTEHAHGSSDNPTHASSATGVSSHDVADSPPPRRHRGSSGHSHAPDSDVSTVIHNLLDTVDERFIPRSGEASSSTQGSKGKGRASSVDEQGGAKRWKGKGPAHARKD